MYRGPHVHSTEDHMYTVQSTICTQYRGPHVHSTEDHMYTVQSTICTQYRGPHVHSTEDHMYTYREPHVLRMVSDLTCPLVVRCFSIPSQNARGGRPALP